MQQQADPGDFAWEGNLVEEPLASPMLPDQPISELILLPVDAPPSANNTILSWSESEGAEGWARKQLMRASALQH